MIKQALSAEKARLLADKLGIIPHSESQWKWALRKLKPFIDKPKELAKAKERIGKLSNRERQLLQVAARKAGLGQEVAITTDKKLIKGVAGTGIIDIPENTILRAHTHPTWKKYVTGKSEPIYFNVPLSARPSGRNYNYNPEAIRALKIKIKNIFKKDLLFFKNFRKKRMVHEAMDTIRKQYAINYDIPFRGLDAKYFTKLKNVSHSILAPEVEGVHKYRENLPRAIRSVYFKGGL